MDVTAGSNNKDPLLALPPEVLRMVCARLPISDLARMGELSRGWRAFAREEALWRDAELPLRLAARRRNVPDVLRVLLRAPCLGLLCTQGVRTLDEREVPKLAQALRKLKKARRLRWVRSVGGAVPLLERLGPHVETLEVLDFSSENLQHIAAAGMLSLRKLVLHLEAGDPDRVDGPGQWSAPPDGSHLRLLEGLQSLRELHLACARRGALPASTTPFDLSLPPQLSALSLPAVTQSQLEAVMLRMPKLRALRLDHAGSRPLSAPAGYPPASSPPAGHRGLRALAVRADQLHPDADAAMLALVRAHAATLEELAVRNDDHERITSSGREQRYLVDELRKCDLKVLRRLVLERSHGHVCGECCSDQIGVLTAALRHCGTVVSCEPPPSYVDKSSNSTARRRQRAGAARPSDDDSSSSSGS